MLEATQFFMHEFSLTYRGPIENINDSVDGATHSGGKYKDENAELQASQDE